MNKNGDLLAFGFLGAIFTLIPFKGVRSDVAEPGYVSSSLVFQETSDEIIDRAIFAGYRNHRRDPDWAFPNEATSAWDFGALTEIHSGSTQQDEYNGYKIAGLIGRKFSDHAQLDFSAGPALLYNGRSLSTPFAELSFTWSPAEVFSTNIRVSRDYVYPELIDPAGAAEGIVSNSLFFDWRYQPLEPVRILFHSSARAFTDGNTRRSSDLGVLYGISSGVPWIWAGLGADYLAYSEYNPGYWSPQEFYSYGPRLEADVPLYQKFSAAGGLNLNRIHQDLYSPGNGYYFSAALRYGLREGTHFEAGYVRIQSIQQSGRWNDDAFSVSFNTSL